MMETPAPHCIAAKYPAYAHGVGRFLGAVNFPLLMRGVTIDVWGVPASNEMGLAPRWATTIGNAVLERLQLRIDEQLGGSSEVEAAIARGAVEEVQIFARHPRSNWVILERYSDQ